LNGFSAPLNDDLQPSTASSSGINILIRRTMPIVPNAVVPNAVVPNAIDPLSKED
jgi:hypothetical protein